jgi:hypothetical protein
VTVRPESVGAGPDPLDVATVARGMKAREFDSVVNIFMDHCLVLGASGRPCVLRHLSEMTVNKVCYTNVMRSACDDVYVIEQGVSARFALVP